MTRVHNEVLITLWASLVMVASVVEELAVTLQSITTALASLWASVVIAASFVVEFVTS